VFSDQDFHIFDLNPKKVTLFLPLIPFRVTDRRKK